MNISELLPLLLQARIKLLFERLRKYEEQHCMTRSVPPSVNTHPNGCFEIDFPDLDPQCCM